MTVPASELGVSFNEISEFGSGVWGRIYDVSLRFDASADGDASSSQVDCNPWKVFRFFFFFFSCRICMYEFLSKPTSRLIHFIPL